MCGVASRRAAEAMIADGRVRVNGHVAQIGCSVDYRRDVVELDGKPADSVKQHYMTLEKTAQDCIRCGACEKRCPFEVRVTERMSRAQKIFGQ